MKLNRSTHHFLNWFNPILFAFAAGMAASMEKRLIAVAAFCCAMWLASANARWSE